MRINEMITQDTMSSYVKNFSLLLLQETYGQQMGIWILILGLGWHYMDSRVTPPKRLNYLTSWVPM